MRQFRLFRAVGVGGVHFGGLGPIQAAALTRPIPLREPYRVFADILHVLLVLRGHVDGVQGYGDVADPILFTSGYQLAPMYNCC